MNIVVVVGIMKRIEGRNNVNTRNRFIRRLQSWKTTFFNYLGSKILTEEYLPTNVIKNNTFEKIVSDKHIQLPL